MAGSISLVIRRDSFPDHVDRFLTRSRLLSEVSMSKGYGERELELWQKFGKEQGGVIQHCLAVFLIGHIQEFNCQKSASFAARGKVFIFKKSQGKLKLFENLQKPSFYFKEQSLKRKFKMKYCKNNIFILFADFQGNSQKNCRPFAKLKS